MSKQTQARRLSALESQACTESNEVLIMIGHGSTYTDQHGREYTERDIQRMPIIAIVKMPVEAL